MNVEDKIQQGAAAAQTMLRIMERAQCNGAVVAMAFAVVNEVDKEKGPFTKEELEALFWETIDSEKAIFNRDPEAYLKYALQATKAKPEDIEGATKVKITFGGPTEPTH